MYIFLIGHIINNVMSRIMFISHVHGPVLGDENEEVVSSGKASDFFSGAVGSNLCLDKENIDLLRFTQTVQANSRIFTD